MTPSDKNKPSPAEAAYAAFDHEYHADTNWHAVAQAAIDAAIERGDVVRVGTLRALQKDVWEWLMGETDDSQALVDILKKYGYAEDDRG